MDVMEKIWLCRKKRIIKMEIKIEKANFRRLLFLLRSKMCNRRYLKSKTEFLNQINGKTVPILSP
jgi:hypothetical protein